MADYGYAPYEEAAAMGQARLSTSQRLLAALSGLGAVRPGAGFGEAFLQGLGGASRNVYLAQTAAQNAAQQYAERQIEAERQRQRDELYKKAVEADVAAKSRPVKPTRTVLDDISDAETALGRKLTEKERQIKLGIYKEPPKPEPVAKPEKPKLGDYDKMSDNFRSEPSVKDFNTVRDSYRRIESSSKLSSGFGDLAMIFSFMKVLDPGSTVREGEFANAQQAMGQLQKTYNIPRQWWTGTRLTPQGRAGLLNAARSFYNSQKATYDSTVRRYKKTATKYGVDPADVITDYGDDSGNDPEGLRGFLGK